MLEELEDITPIGVVSLTLPAKTKVGAAGRGSPIIKADVSDKIEEDDDEEDYEEEDEEYDEE